MKENLSLFKQIEQELKHTESLSYPQYALVSVEEILNDIGIGQNEEVEIKISLEKVIFSKIGKYPVIVTLLSPNSKERSFHVISINIYPSKRNYALLKNIYWRTYGLVLEGQLNYTDSSVLSQKKEIINYVELVPLAKGEIADVEHLICKKKLSLNQKKFHIVLENQDLKLLRAGKYRVQISTVDQTNGITHSSRVIEKENVQFFSFHSLEYSLVAQTEDCIIEEKNISVITNESNELLLHVFA